MLTSTLKEESDEDGDWEQLIMPLSLSAEGGCVPLSHVAQTPMSPPISPTRLALPLLASTGSNNDYGWSPPPWTVSSSLSKSESLLIPSPPAASFAPDFAAWSPPKWAGFAQASAAARLENAVVSEEMEEEEDEEGPAWAGPSWEFELPTIHPSAAGGQALKLLHQLQQQLAPAAAAAHGGGDEWLPPMWAFMRLVGDALAGGGEDKEGTNLEEGERSENQEDGEEEEEEKGGVAGQWTTPRWSF